MTAREAALVQVVGPASARLPHPSQWLSSAASLSAALSQRPTGHRMRQWNAGADGRMAV